MNEGPAAYSSVFDIIGPVMIGPSSSHTAGANRIARVARKLLGDMPHAVRFGLKGSFAETYKGHGTDRALAAGVLGIGADDPRLPDALELAALSGVQITFIKESVESYHPNTVRIDLQSRSNHVQIVGSSLGGGKIKMVEVDRFPVNLSGDRTGLVVWHGDAPGFIVTLLEAVSGQGMNVARMTVDRVSRNGSALTALEIDGEVSVALVESVAACCEQRGLRYRWLDKI